MRQPNFQPRPPRPQRGIVRWILLFIHMMPFIALVFVYQSLSLSEPDVFSGNLIWLGILAWGLLILAHFALVILLELREAMIFAARERRRRQYYQKMRTETHERQRELARHPETRIYDEDDLEPQQPR